ncbi:MAG TPA: methyltransferase domain-containing protein [Chloroflexota bacterium]|nr:methyltransferase domain-containing protein [Chloroflexota bacterium]
MGTPILAHGFNKRIFDDASTYYQQMRWFKTRLTRFEYDLTRRVLLEELSPRPTASMLEVGCGPGTWTKEVAPLVNSLVALDISDEMIARARPYVDAANVEYIHTDAAQYEPAQAFDAVFSVRVVEYLEDWRPVVSRLVRAVKPGGRGVIITKTPISVYRGTGRNLAVARPIRRVQRRILGQPEPESHPFWQRYLPPTELARVFKEQGFTDVRIRPVIYGLPIFMRGTKQYPLVPSALEPAALRIFERAWELADRLPAALAPAALVFSESYAVSGTRSGPKLLS